VTSPTVLGIAASHNGAACIMRAGRVEVAVQEERLSRHKRARLLPGSETLAISACLAACGLAPRDLDRIVIAPLPNPEAEGMCFSKDSALAGIETIFVSHHRAHAASVLAWSGWRDGVILVADGFGSTWSALPDDERCAVVGAPPVDAAEGALWRESMSLYRARDGRLEPLAKQLGRVAPPRGLTALGPFQSAGLMYQVVAQRLFGSWDAAGKLMGLAPFGDPERFPVDLFWSMGPDGIRWNDGPSGIGGVLARLPPGSLPPVGATNLELSRVAVDLAASTQRALESVVLQWVSAALALSGETARLGLAGGVFLNACANQRIVASGFFDEVFAVPAAEDSGTAIGAAWLGAGGPSGPPLSRDALGPDHEAAMGPAIDAFLAPHAGIFEHRQMSDLQLFPEIAAELAAGRVVGWFEGRSELGPRALGQRSILFDPRRGDARERLNFQVKRREGFRPFAPAVLVESAAEWFDFGTGDAESPWMLRVVPVRPDRRATIPGVTHVDGTARVQTVDASHRRFHGLIRAFADRTGVPLVLNTSFNVAGEPLVETPADALRCFKNAAIDTLVLGNHVLRKR
jgi:carbamoyltransferase